ncbi:hypothetical protein D3C75_731300 [compost metagenome]
MLVTVGKTHHFVFDRRAITWANAFDNTGIHRAAIEIITNNVMRFFVGVRDVTRHLRRVLVYISHEREHRHWVIPMLLGKYAEIYGASVNTRWSTGF